MCLKKRMRGCKSDKNECPFISSILDGAKGSAWKPRTSQWPPTLTSGHTVVVLSPRPSSPPLFPSLFPLLLHQPPGSVGQSSWSLPCAELGPAGICCWSQKRSSKEQWAFHSDFPRKQNLSQAWSSGGRGRTYFLCSDELRKVTLSCHHHVAPRLEILVQQT